MTDGEKYYDEHIAPKLLDMAKDARAHGMNFLAIVEWAPGEHGRTHYCVEGTQGVPFRMANWAARCNGNVDSFLMAVQRYAMKHGHGSIFLAQLGIPEKPSQPADGESGGEEGGYMTCKFGFPMVAAARLDECTDMAMDWLAKDQAFHEAHGGRNKSDYWRNQWQLHGAMLARIESRHGHDFMPKPTPADKRCGTCGHWRGLNELCKNQNAIGGFYTDEKCFGKYWIQREQQ